MKEIRIGVKYTVVVPNSKRYKISGNFSGTKLFTEITSQTGLSHPEMSLNSQDQIAEILFNKDHKVGTPYDMITTEQELVVKSYDKPPVKKSIATRQHFRGEVEEGRKALFPFLNVANCYSFDQSYFIRTIGQIRIQENLGNNSALFTGAGFGAIQAFWGALDRKAVDLAKWFVNDLKKAIHKGPVRKTSEFVIGVLLEHDGKRLNPSRAKKAIRKLFKKDAGDLLVRDCKKDIFIPVEDISGRIKVVTKETYPDLPIYQVLNAAVFDPIFFKTKPEVKGLGVLNGDIAKNNNYFLRKNNPNLNITSVGCPVRLFDKGTESISREDLALKVSDRKHETDLMVEIDGPYKRIQCNPIDEVYQFATDQKSIELAFASGDING
jgi:hypothetical protein